MSYLRAARLLEHKKDISPPVWGCPGAPGELAQWMVLDPSDCLICLSSQSAGWGDNSEFRAVAGHQAYPGWTEF